MQHISTALKEKNLKYSELPNDLKSEIDELKKMGEKYNESCDEYESLEESERDVEIEKKLDEMENSITEVELDLAQKIRNLSVQEEQQETKIKPQTEQQQVQVQQKIPAQKKDSSVGWLLFGGVALVVTLGMVNVFKKQ